MSIACRKFKSTLRVFALSFFIVFSFGNALAQDYDSVLHITQQQELILLSRYVSFVKDSSGTMTLSDVRSHESNFQPIRQEMYSTFQDRHVDAYWLKIKVLNETGQALNDLLYFHPGIDTVQVYHLQPDGAIIETTVSSLVTTIKRPLHISQELAVPLTLRPGTSSIYIHIFNSTKYSKQLGHIILNLAERDAFVNYFLRLRHYHGIALGMLLVMAIFHIFIYLFFGGRTYLFYVLNLIITLVYLSIQKFYTTEIPLLEPLYPYLRYVHDPAGALVCLTVILFTQSFLDTKTQDPILHKVMDGLNVVLAIVALGMFLLIELHALNIISIYLGLFTTLLVIIVSLRSFLRGNRYALYVFFGYLLFLVVPILYLIPMPGYMHYRNNESDYHYYAEAIRVLIFAVGIADQFNGVRKAANRAKKEKEKLEQEKAGQLQAERERISRELHDNFGSRITNLGLAMGRLEVDHNRSAKITELQDQLEQIMIELRNTIWVIEKDEIRADDLEMKIRNMIWQFQKSNDSIQFDFQLSSKPDCYLTATQAVNILRVLQESIHNSIRHGKPQHIYIRLETNGEECTLISEDDGIGFDPHMKPAPEHFGLMNMRRRAASIGGTVSFEPLNGKGASVRMKFPVVPPR